MGHGVTSPCCRAEHGDTEATIQLSAAQVIRQAVSCFILSTSKLLLLPEEERKGERHCQSNEPLRQSFQCAIELSRDIHKVFLPRRQFCIERCDM